MTANMDDASRRREGEGAGRPAPSLIHRTDLGLAAVILAVCGFLWYQTASFGEVSPLLQQGITPTYFPRLILGVIIVLTLLVPFEHIAHTRRGENIDEARSKPIRPITFVTAGLLVAAAVLSPWLGTFLTMVFVCALLPLLWGERRYWLIALYAAVFPVAVGVLFVAGLQVNFVPGLVGHIFR